MKISLITLMMISLMPLLAWSMNQVSKESMVQYRNQGWKVEEMKSFVESRPGKRPYQMLKRVHVPRDEVQSICDLEQ